MNKTKTQEKYEKIIKEASSPNHPISFPKILFQALKEQEEEMSPRCCRCNEERVLSKRGVDYRSTYKSDKKI